MATGVEVAGIALAVFPIAVHGLTQMREGIETIKHWKRFRVKLDEYAAELTTAKVFYLDTLEELFMDIVGSDKELLILMNEPGGPAWKKPEYEQSLRRRLDRSYDSYLQIMFKMQNALSEMRMELGIDESGKVLWHDYPSVQREVKRLRLTLKRNICKEAIVTINKSNKDLRDFTHQNIYLEPVRRKRRSQRVLDEVRLIRAHATSLYKGFIAGEGWQCQCQKSHMVALELRKKPRTIYYEPRNGKLDQYECEIFMTTASSANDRQPGPEWRNIKLVPRLLSHTKPPNEQHEQHEQDNQVPPRPKPPGKTVTFAEAGTIAATSATLGEEAFKLRRKSSVDFCGDLQGVKESQYKQKPMGTLVAQDNENHEHYFEFTDLGSTLASHIQLISLTDLLNNPTHQSLRIWWRRLYRLHFAMNLAFSVLQLDGTSWLESEWTSHDVFFRFWNLSTDRSSPKDYPGHTEYQTYYLPWKQCMNSCTPSSTSRLRSSGRKSIKSSGLFTLGLTLIEIGLGEALTDMQTNEDDGITETAWRVLERVDDEMGWPYGDAVRRCLVLPVEVRDSSMDSESMQQKVFDEIATPLLVTLNDFDKGRDY